MKPYSDRTALVRVRAHARAISLLEGCLNPCWLGRGQAFLLIRVYQLGSGEEAACTGHGCGYMVVDESAQRPGQKPQRRSSMRPRIEALVARNEVECIIQPDDPQPL